MTAGAGPGPLGSNFRRLLAATTTVNLGDGLSAVAVPWLASTITRSPLQIALVTLATRLPWLVVSLPAGVITDRVDRRRLVASMDAVRAVLMTLFAIVVLMRQSDLGTPDDVASGLASTPSDAAPLLGLLYVVAVLIGCAEVLRDNSAQTLLPSIVPARRLERANGRMWGAEIVMNQFVGPPLAGALIGVALAVPFFVNAGTFAVGAALVCSLAGSFAPTGGAAATGHIDWRAEIGEGVRWLWGHELLRSLALLLSGMNAMSAMSTAVFVLFAQEVLELDAGRFGLLLTGTAAGAVLGSLVADRVAARLSPGRALLASIVGMGISLAVIGTTSSAIVVWVVLLPTGFLTIVWNVITVSLRQTIIPDHLLGRVNSVYRFFGWGTIAIGGLVGGLLVTIGEPVVGRADALRAPFLVAAGAHVGLFAYGRRRLCAARIEEAKAAAPAR